MTIKILVRLTTLLYFAGCPGRLRIKKVEALIQWLKMVLDELILKQP